MDAFVDPNNFIPNTQPNLHAPLLNDIYLSLAIAWHTTAHAVEDDGGRATAGNATLLSVTPSQGDDAHERRRRRCRGRPRSSQLLPAAAPSQTRDQLANHTNHHRQYQLQQVVSRASNWFGHMAGFAELLIAEFGKDFS